MTYLKFRFNQATCDCFQTLAALGMQLGRTHSPTPPWSPLCSLNLSVPGRDPVALPALFSAASSMAPVGLGFFLLWDRPRSALTTSCRGAGAPCLPPVTPRHTPGATSVAVRQARPRRAETQTLLSHLTFKIALKCTWASLVAQG